MAKLKLPKPFQFKRQRRGFKFPAPSRPDLQMSEEQEQLTGMVRGMKASAPEERLAKALEKKGYQYLFRYVVGAPKGLPGWKELDFVVHAGGVVHPIEVDTAFTHRGKAASDQLHDAIVMNDIELNSMGRLAPGVKHADGDAELSSQQLAEEYVKKNLGDPTPPWSSLPEFPVMPPAKAAQQPPPYIPVQEYDEPSGAQQRSREKHRQAFKAKQQYNQIKAILEQQLRDKKNAEKNKKSVPKRPPRKSR